MPKSSEQRPGRVGDRGHERRADHITGRGRATQMVPGETRGGSSAQGVAREPFLVFGAPNIGADEIQEVIDSLRSGWIGTGPKVQRFEEQFAGYIGARHAVAVNSCTAALHLSLLVAGVGPGDEVITTTMTFPATVAEDAAHAVEAVWRGRKVGTLGDFTCFSFYVTKNMTTGEGGMITTADPAMAEKLKTYGLHGLSGDAWKRFSTHGYRHYDVVYPGFKYNMTDLQAAIGLHQLARVDGWLPRRTAIWRRYNEAFADLPVGLPAPDLADCVHARHPPPPHRKQSTSTSAEGSVNGKNDGRNRILERGPNISCAKRLSVPLRSAIVTSRSTARPSTCWNIGECVRSATSRR